MGRRRRSAGIDLPEATGIVLAGGRSSRFGRDKLAEPYRGRPLLHHVVLRLAEACDEIVVVLGPETGEPVMPTEASVRFARDAERGGGPLAGVHAGLRVVRSNRALVVGGDTPDLRLPVLREMLRVAEEAGVGAVALVDGDRLRPLPCVLTVRRAIETAAALLDDGHRRLLDLLEAMAATAIAETTWRAFDPDGRTMFDVDELADLDR